MGGRRNKNRRSSTIVDDFERPPSIHGGASSFSRILELAGIINQVRNFALPSSSESSAEIQDEAKLAQMKQQLEMKEREIELLKKEVELRAMTSTSKPQTMTFGDVKDSLPKFPGEDGYSLDRWIQDLEDAAGKYGWSDLQTMTYAKQLLDGDAKLALRITAFISKWADLKTFLKKEFGTTQFLASVHESDSAKVVVAEEEDVKIQEEVEKPPAPEVAETIPEKVELKPTGEKKSKAIEEQPNPKTDERDEGIDEEAKPTPLAELVVADDEALKVEEVRSVYAVVVVELTEVEERETGSGDDEEDDDDGIAVTMESVEESVAAIVGRSDDGGEKEMNKVVIGDEKEAECENGDSADLERCWFAKDTWVEYGLPGCWIWRSPHKKDEIMERVAGQKFLPRFRDPCEMTACRVPSMIHLGQMYCRMAEWEWWKCGSPYTVGYSRFSFC